MSDNFTGNKTNPITSTGTTTPVQWTPPTATPVPSTIYHNPLQQNLLNPVYGQQYASPYYFGQYGYQGQQGQQGYNNMIFGELKKLDTKLNVVTAQLDIISNNQKIDLTILLKNFSLIEKQIDLVQKTNDILIKNNELLTSKIENLAVAFDKHKKSAPILKSRPYTPQRCPPVPPPGPPMDLRPPSTSIYSDPYSADYIKGLLNKKIDTKNPDTHKDSKKSPIKPKQDSGTSMRTGGAFMMGPKVIDPKTMGEMKPENFMSFLNFTDGLFGKKIPKQETKPYDDDEESIISEVTEYTSDDEFEELDVTIENLDDLIKLGDFYEKIKDTKPDAKVEIKTLEKEKLPEDEVDDSMTDEYIQMNTMEALEKFGISMDFYEKELGKRPDVKIIARATLADEDAEDGDEESSASDTIKVKKGGYIINGKRYSINLETLYKLRKPLTELKSMIGMEKVKDTIVDLVLYYIQKFEKGTSDMLHTIIEGPPGVGKTEVGKILGKVFRAMGVISSDSFRIVTRTDLIGEYLGHTAAKTQKVFDEADGGVLFIDEAYSLGNEEKRDSFAKECIDTINMNLDKKKKNLIVIIAGYKKELERSFFSYNPGLKRRFPFVFSIDGYKPEQLKDIFLKKVGESQWSLNTETLDDDKLVKFFKDNKDKFPHFGGDMETLFQACKLAHSKRTIGKHPKLKRKLIEKDILDGFDKFKNMRKKEESGIPEYLITGMYS